MKMRVKMMMKRMMMKVDVMVEVRVVVERSGKSWLLLVSLVIACQRESAGPSVTF